MTTDNKQVTATGRPKPPAAGKGRPKGSKNKTTLAAKEAISAAAEGLGGVDRMIKWAQEDAANERVFWGTIYPKLIGVDVNVEAGKRLARALTWRPTT